MKFKCAMILVLVSVLSFGCEFPVASRRREPSQRLPEQPLKVLDAEAGGTTDQNVEDLMDALKEQEAALEADTTTVANVATPAGEDRDKTETSSAVDASGKSTDAGAADELSVANLLSRLAEKSNRSPSEEEAYRRLLRLTPRAPAGDAAEDDEYALLGQARDALLAGHLDEAQALANRALFNIRGKTDPVIDRVCFAVDVRNYGDANVVSPAEFRRGQRIMVVTDLSNFACLPVAGESTQRIYHTKMTQRIAIYDTDGKLYWQQNYGALEYQASHYISTMFVPQKFNLPQRLQAGEYVLKVEIGDELAGRETEGSTRFRVK